MTDDLAPNRQPNVTRLLDKDGAFIEDSNPLPISIQGASGSVTINVDEADLASLGAVGDAAYTDATGAASGALVGLFKGAYVKLAAIASALVGYLLVRGYAFDVLDAPATTNGAYSVGDVIGGYREVDNIARANDELVLITGVQVVFKAAVQPNIRVVIFGVTPVATLADNAAYSLSAADVLTVRKSLSSLLLGASYTSHGTPKSISLTPPPFVAKPIAGTKKIGYYLIDDTGVTLTSTADVQVRFSGLGV